MYKPPKEITNHSGVEECLDAKDEGILEYKHHVWLKEGWAFFRGRMAGCRQGNFNSVAEFRNAEPKQH